MPRAPPEKETPHGASLQWGMRHIARRQSQRLWGLGVKRAARRTPSETPSATKRETRFAEPRPGRPEAQAPTRGALPPRREVRDQADPTACETTSEATRAVAPRRIGEPKAALRPPSRRFLQGVWVREKL